MSQQDRMRAAMEAREVLARDTHFRRCLAVQGERDPVTGRLVALPSGVMGSAYDDAPLVEPADVDLLQMRPAAASSTVRGFPPALTAACRRHGPLRDLEDDLAAHARTPAFLHCGLLLALAAGHAKAAELLLDHGAPILRETPQVILSPRPAWSEGGVPEGVSEEVSEGSSSLSTFAFASPSPPIDLFAVLLRHGWTPNTPGYYGRVLLPTVAAGTGRGEAAGKHGLALLRWFLDSGADPNRGAQPDSRDRGGHSDTASCQALETAASCGSAAAVAMLLQAGALLQNGHPLHAAAEAAVSLSSSSPPGASRESGTGYSGVQRLLAMEALVAAGADINQARISRHMQPDYALICAIFAGAADRVRWLLQHGADPHLRGRYGTAAECAQKCGSEAVRQAMQESLAGGTR